jgi:hypothetical protein
MILKIERYTDSQKWWMFDGIRKISVSRYFPKRGSTADPTNAHDAIIFDMPACGCEKYTSDNGAACSDCKDYIVIICRLEDGSEYSVAFDTICYVLNDDGKTIEKIVANYNE